MSKNLDVVHVMLVQLIYIYIYVCIYNYIYIYVLSEATWHDGLLLILLSWLNTWFKLQMGKTHVMNISWHFWPLKTWKWTRTPPKMECDAANGKCGGSWQFSITIPHKYPPVHAQNQDQSWTPKTKKKHGTSRTFMTSLPSGNLT